MAYIVKLIFKYIKKLKNYSKYEIKTDWFLYWQCHMYEIKNAVFKQKYKNNLLNVWG